MKARKMTSMAVALCMLMSILSSMAVPVSANEETVTAEVVSAETMPVEIMSIEEPQVMPLVMVCGVTLTPENADDILGDGTVSYNDAEQELILNNFNYSGPGFSHDNSGENWVIYIGEDVSITVIGQNNIEMIDEYGDYIYDGAAIKYRIAESAVGTLRIKAPDNINELNTVSILNIDTYCGINTYDNPLTVSVSTVNTNYIETGDLIVNQDAKLNADCVSTNSMSAENAELNIDFATVVGNCNLINSNSAINNIFAADFNISSGSFVGIVHIPNDETPDEYDNRVTVYGENIDQGYIGADDVIEFQSGAKLIETDVLRRRVGADIPALIPYLEGDGLIHVYDNEYVLQEAYLTDGTQLTVRSGMNFVDEPYTPNEEGVFAYDEATKTLTLENNVYITYGEYTTVKLPTGSTININGKAWIDGDIEISAPNDEAHNLNIAGGELVAAHFILNNGALKVATGATLNTNSIYAKDVIVDGTLIAISQDASAINVLYGKLIRNGTGETGGSIYAQNRTGYDAISIYITPEDAAQLTETEILNRYLVLNNGIEQYDAVARLCVNRDEENIISFFREGNDPANGRGESIVDIDPPQEMATPEPTSTPQPTSPPTYSGGGGGTRTYDVIYHSGTETDEKVYRRGNRKNTAVTVEGGDIFEAPENMAFTGWAETENGEVVYNENDEFMMPSKTVNLYAIWEETAVTPSLNKEDHIAYIEGYPDGSVGPMYNISREETAAIYFRLLDDTTREYYWSQTHSFDDVEQSRWSNIAIATLANAGIVEGRTQTQFEPDAPITRAEYASIAARFDSEPYSGSDSKFPDTVGHWAEEYINRAAARGWIIGDSDGNFRPDDYITRAEAVTLINRVLERNPKLKENLHNSMITFTDNLDETAWFYIDIQEAANSHEYVRNEDGTETWTNVDNSDLGDMNR